MRDTAGVAKLRGMAAKLEAVLPHAPKRRAIHTGKASELEVAPPAHHPYVHSFLLELYHSCSFLLLPEMATFSCVMI